MNYVWQRALWACASEIQSAADAYWTDSDGNTPIWATFVLAGAEAVLTELNIEAS